MTTRRDIVGAGVAGLMAALAGAIPASAQAGRADAKPGTTAHFGVIRKLNVHAGHREALMEILGIGVEAMQGNIAYLIGKDLADPGSIWITEYWESRAAHDNAMILPEVEAAMAVAKPLIANIAQRVELELA